MSKSSIRGMLREDLPSVLAIEEAQPHPWTKLHFVDCLHDTQRAALICEMGPHIAGFIIYERPSVETVRILNLRVDAPFRRQSVGTLLVSQLHTRLGIGGAEEIITTVRERNVVAQLFFRALDFRASSMVPRCYPDTEEDGINFRYVFRPRRPH